MWLDFAGTKECKGGIGLPIASHQRYTEIVALVHHKNLESLETSMGFRSGKVWRRKKQNKNSSEQEKTRRWNSKGRAAARA